MVLVLIDHDRGTLDELSLQAVTAARALAEALGVSQVEGVVVGEAGRPVAAELEAHGLAGLHILDHAILSDFAPEAWGEALAQLIIDRSPSAVVGVGTERGNEVMAYAAAVLDLPFVANCTEVNPDDPWTITRVRWGGSLLEEVSLETRVPMLTVAAHAFGAEPVGGGGPPIDVFNPELGDHLARTRVTDRVTLDAGITLTSAPVVVSGGRGVGSPEGFAVLEELAELLGGAVGCSRVATNNGWRPHSDQVGQTGTRVAPELYIACGISGAIQHWVGCMASKTILAINTDAQASMVTKADYAVIGDLHEVLNAVVAEVKSQSAG